MKDGQFPTHSVTVADPGKPYTKWFTTVGYFDTDEDAIAAAVADYPMKEVRITNARGFVIYDSRAMHQRKRR